MNSKRSSTVLVALLALAGGAGQARGAAQPETAVGIVTGQVSNAATRTFLEGAIVRAGADGPTAFTDRRGYFELPLAAGAPHTLEVSFTGLDSASITVALRPGERLTRDIALTSEIYRLEKFTVAGEREGNALAISEQRNAANVKNVISSDSFGDISSFNLGNILLRVPGIAYKQQEGETTQIYIRGVNPELNSVTVDGTRAANGSTRSYTRGFVIDTAPADFIGLIEVTKAGRPDMDADSIGGSINLRSRTAFDVQGRRISYQAGASYAVRQKTLDPQFSVGFSDQFRGRKLGVIATGSFSRTNRPWDTSIINYEQTLATDRPVWFVPLVWGLSEKGTERIGANVRFDYKFTETTRVFLAVIGSQYTDFLDRRWGRLSGPAQPTVTLGPNIVSVTDNVTITRNQTFSYQQETRDRDIKTLNFKLGGEAVVAGGKLDFDLNFSPSKGTEVRFRLINSNVAGAGFRLDRSASGRFEYLELTQVSGPDILDPRNRTQNQMTLPDTIASRDNILGGQANWRRPVETVIPLTVKAGVRGRLQRRALDNQFRVFDYVGPNGVIGPVGANNDDNLARFLDPTPRAVVYNYPRNLPFLRQEDFKAELRNNPQHFAESYAVETRDSLRLDSIINEDVASGYVMAEARLGRLDVLGGVRAESTQTRSRGYKDQVTAAEAARRAAFTGPLTPTEIIRRNTAQYGNPVDYDGERYTNYFPSAHLAYRLPAGFVARASYSTGIGRPNFTNLAPTAVFDDDRQTIVSNNPSLQPQFSKNYDVALEYYFKPAGLVSIAAFQKNLRDFIYRQGGATLGNDSIFGPAYAGYMLTTDYNGGRAKIKGLEFSWQQQFSNLPGFLRGLGAFGNFTWLQSRGDYGQAGAALTAAELPDFTPRTGNAGLSYLGHGWTIRAKLNYTANRLNNFQVNPAQRVYQRGSQPIDLDVAYALSPRVTIFANAINVFDVPITNTYQYVPSRLNISQRFSTLINFGVKGTF